MNRKDELQYIIKGIKADLYNAFIELNNDKDNKTINKCKSLLEALEISKNEYNKL
jgi:hypothetical protein